MKIQNVAAQLYTVRAFTKTAADYASTLRRLRAIGYQAIQISAVGPIPPKILRDIAADEGLTICATHEPSLKILHETGSVIARLQELGCVHCAYPGPAGVALDDPEQVEALFADLRCAWLKMKEAGITLSYHNHHVEFFHYKGRPLLESIYEEVPQLHAELDTYWIQAGGHDPVAWCRKMAGRLSLLHLKDYQVTLEPKPWYAEIGSGNLDIKAIVAAAEASGCCWYIVEQDECPGDPFDALKTSFDYLKTHIANH